MKFIVNSLPTCREDCPFFHEDVYYSGQDDEIISKYGICKLACCLGLPETSCSGIFWSNIKSCAYLEEHL